MEEIRARIDAIVTHRETAQKLKAWYRQLASARASTMNISKRSTRQACD
jgi:hypothetical protein